MSRFGGRRGYYHSRLLGNTPHRPEAVYRGESMVLPPPEGILNIGMSRELFVLRGFCIFFQGDLSWLHTMALAWQVAWWVLGKDRV